MQLMGRDWRCVATKRKRTDESVSEGLEDLPLEHAARNEVLAVDRDDARAIVDLAALSDERGAR